MGVGVDMEVGMEVGMEVDGSGNGGVVQCS